MPRSRHWIQMAAHPTPLAKVSSGAARIGTRARLPGGDLVRRATCVQTRPPRRPVSAVASTQSSSGKDDRPAFRVLITGSTKGLGLALARRFLEAGDRVLITSRDGTRVAETVQLLQHEAGREQKDRVCGTTADVSRPESVTALADFAVTHMGGVDLWINNAGANGYVFQNLVDSDPAVLSEIVLTNSLGSLLCCRAAIKLMLEQSSGGHVFNLLGAGSDGNATRKYAAYGHTKAGLVQLTKTLAGEVEGTAVGVHAISPGMVFTELLSSGRYAFGSRGRFFVNIIAEPPAFAAEKIVDNVRAFILETRDQSEGAAGGTSLALPPLFGRGATKSATFEVFTPAAALYKLARRLVLGEGKDRYYREADDEDKVPPTV